MLRRLFSSAPRSSISADLVLSASMGYTGKVTSKTHIEHAEALKKLNLYQDSRIDKVFSVLDKADFCQAQSVTSMKEKVPDFNPYSLDPQDIGLSQVLTSTVMHAVTMQHLVKLLEAEGPVNMLDVGCGKGFSTIAYAMLAHQIKSSNYTMTGVDYHSNFMERAGLNQEKYAAHLAPGTVKFRRHDYLKEDLSQKYGLVTFGFEVSLDVLRAKQACLEQGAHLLVPLSEVDESGNLLSLEQDFCILKYQGSDQFDVVQKIMKTAFSRRIDRDRVINEQIDHDYFLNSQRSNRLQQLEQKVSDLETQFKQLTTGRNLKLAELVQEPEIKSVLVELRSEKKRLEKLKFAMADTEEFQS